MTNESTAVIYKILFMVQFFMVILISSNRSPDHHAKLILIDTADQRFELSGRQCHGGVFISKPQKFKCVCVSGIWGLYEKYCETPFSIVAAQNECFKIPETLNIVQLVIFGNPVYPFEPAILHFRENYSIVTGYYAYDTRDLDLDPSAPFATIMTHEWELESDTGETICLLSDNLNSKKKFCYYNHDHWAKGQVTPWNLIVRIRKGCRPETSKQYSTNCVDIPSNPDFPQRNEPCGSEIIPFPNNTRATPEPKILTNKNSSNMPTTTEMPFVTGISIVIDFPETTLATTEEPYECPTEISREDVKTYWTNDEARDCPKDVTEALVINQLQHLAVKKMQKVFPVRLDSLKQVAELLNLTALVMSKTCPKEAVSSEFVTDVTSAFTAIIEEDFFYGVERLEFTVFERLVATLQNCIERASPFNLSITKRHCQQVEVTGTVHLNGTERPIDLPAQASSSNFEPIIEASWKIFLNAHAYCYADFVPSIDHHHFSTFFFALFSESIYEKWNSPLESTELYKFILPSTTNLTLTMTNLDYCVGATSLNSPCQTWLQRNTELPPESRGKRSIWDTYMERARTESRIWNGLGHCLQSPEEPAFKLGYAKCPHPV